MPILCLSLIAVAFAIACPLTWLLIALGRRLGQLDVPDAPGSGGRKTHGKPIPNTGGVAIYVAVAGPMLLALLAIRLLPQDRWSGPLAPVQPYIDGLRLQSPMAIGLLLAMTVIHVLGLVDDRRRLGPFLKLGVQAAVAAGLVLAFDLRILDVLAKSWDTPGFILSALFSVAWIIVVTNAMNFLDNMDGLSAGVGAVAAGMYLATTLIGGQWFVAATAALLLGALLGFLLFNFPHARVFMGDGGSLVLGLLLAVISIRTTYFDPRDAARSVHWYAVLTPLLVLAIPLYDFTSVTLIRIAQGRSPFVGDQQHFSHRLVKRGLSKRRAVMLIWALTLCTGAGGMMLGHVGGGVATLLVALTAVILTTIAVLERR
ncbi:MAG: undecaprenyl/decaprenyl-phosphate alpha-N-acetylglucosaminyl 1-phosphate transferase [Planctomycetes bacterium]|nr:undecaprenyl/decaprenyl-phosphate alpha-N-acetylglucosaminyl 1-phosphate transferase [Planctomycetota bacterium]